MKITREVFEIGNLFSQSFKKEKVFKCVVCSCNFVFFSLRLLRKKKRLNANLMPPALLTCINAAMPPSCLPSAQGILPF